MDNQNRTNTQDEVTFAEIVRMFRGKLKVLICVALVAAIVGGAAGVLSSKFSEVYGSDIEFYLSPETNTQALLQYLKSDAFAERLLLNEYGLPEGSDRYDGYDEAKNAVKEEFAARDLVIELNKTFTDFNYYVSTDPNAKDHEKMTFNEVDNRHKELLAQYEECYALLEVYKNAYSDIVAGQESHLQKTKEYEDAVADALEELEEYREKYYYPKTEQKRALTDALSRARAELKKKREIADKKVEAVLAQWRNDPEIQSSISLIQDSVTYKYATVIDDNSNNSISNIDKIEQNTNYSFLEVSVAVDDDQVFANDIVEKIKNSAPDLIAVNLERLADCAEVKCTLISTNAKADSIGEVSTVQNAVLYAGVAAVLAVVLVCAVVVVRGILRPNTCEKKKSSEKQ